MVQYSRWLYRFHGTVVVYLLTGVVVASQRPILVVLLPTLQFQFLVNNNECVLTQLENKLLALESGEEEKDSARLTFVGKKLKEYNINISRELQARISNSLVYGSFLLNYWLM